MSKKISEMPAKTGPMVTADEFTILDSADANPATKNKKIARELALGSRQPVAPVSNQLGVNGGWTPAGTAAEADIGSGDADVVVNSVLAADFAAHNASGAAHSGNLPTATEKAALAGDGGTPPGAANPYATMDDLSGAGGAVSSVEGVSTVKNVGLTVGDVQLELDNDQAAPGGKQVYGTDNLGNKGWYDAAAVDSIDGRNSIYSVSGNNVGHVVLELDGDAATPGANQVYGTDGAGDKGWKPDPAGGGGDHNPVTLNASLTDVLALSVQELQAVDAGAADAIVGWDDSASKTTYLAAVDVRAVINVEDGATAAGAAGDAFTTSHLSAFAHGDIATALQPGDDAAGLGSGAATDNYVLTADGAGNAAWEAAAGGGGSTDEFLFGFSITNTVSPITVSERKSFRMPFDCVLTRIYVGCKTAPTGSAVTFDVEDGGTSLLNAVLSVAISGFSSETSTFTGSASNYPLTKGDVVTVDCDQKDSNDVAREFDISFFGYRP